ncbi:hypothetical protein HELRODRAFT_179783 [Helobdella robusta]|uniref:MARVEL domain-containing protein n=1 Tax=Helobdella robusta TaxID=6412 RepID=T1FF54_HELRO|nr:hypothetical protein HELRODRAFT_179783 [Helobdella robusta]ESN95183.1 hypothetical protein HELRODRAFT_179783 [Helobdella robusta]
MYLIYPNFPASLSAIQGIMIAAFVIYIIMLLIMITHMYIVIDSYQPIPVMFVYIIASFFTAILLTAALITYGVVVKRNFSFSYGLVVIGAFLAFLSGGMSILHMKILY